MSYEFQFLIGTLKIPKSMTTTAFSYYCVRSQKSRSTYKCYCYKFLFVVDRFLDKCLLKPYSIKTFCDFLTIIQKRH